MVRLRLTRIGRKNAPAYRIQAVHRNYKRDGQALELIGHYNPSEHPIKLVINKERYDYWVSQGAQPSDAVAQLYRGTYNYKPYGKAAKTTEAQSETQSA